MTHAPRRGRPGASGLAPIALAGSLVTALALAGCGGDDKDDKAPEAKSPCGITEQRTKHLTLANAATELAEASDRRMTLRFRQELEQDGQTASIEGVADSSPGQLHAFDQTLPGPDGPIRLIHLEGKSWVSAEEKGKFYLIDPDDEADPLAAPMKAYLDSTAPASAVEGWKAGLLAVRHVSDETLDDGSVTEVYEFDVDPRLAARAAGEEVPRGLPAIVTSFVWVDQWNLVHKTQTEVAGEKRTEFFSGYCEPIDVEAPDAEDLLPR